MVIKKKVNDGSEWRLMLIKCDEWMYHPVFSVTLPENPPDCQRTVSLDDLDMNWTSTRIIFVNVSQDISRLMAHKRPSKPPAWWSDLQSDISCCKWMQVLFLKLTRLNHIQVFWEGLQDLHLEHTIIFFPETGWLQLRSLQVHPRSVDCCARVGSRGTQGASAGRGAQNTGHSWCACFF